MAKTKVFELAKEFEIKSSDVLTFLQEKGIEAKAAQSSLEDDAASLVRSHFGKKSAPVEKPAEPKAEKTEKPEAPKAAPVKTEEPKQEKSGEEESPKKKKKIIFVSNPNNSKIQGQNSRPQGNNGQRNGNGNGNNNGANRRPQGGQNNNNNGRGGNTFRVNSPTGRPLIRSSVKPSPVTNDYDGRASQPQRRQERPANEQNKPVNNTVPAANEAVQSRPAEKPAQAQQQSQERRPSSNFTGRTAPQVRPAGVGNGQYGQNRNGQNRTDRPGNRDSRPNNGNGNGERRFDGQNRTGFGNSQGSRGNYGGNGQGNRPANGGVGGQRGNAGPGNRPGNKFQKPAPGKGFASEAPMQNEKPRDDKKRRNNQERDNRSKKDHIYEDDNSKVKTNKAGRFIKPEKKEEAPEEQIKVITVPETLTIKELADKMKMQPSVIIKKLFLQGQVVTVNSELSFEEAENIAIDYDIICEKEVKVDVIEELLKEEDEDEAEMTSRPPVVCVMGHVDHGKTSLLDAIRKTNVTDKEAGGITQAIGAYTVQAKGQSITFLDTPGHEAFTAMRMRGANATDIAVLVVAADDGVMPQTVEAINHAKAAGVEIIVAVNKIDKPGANVEKVKQEMTEYELIPVDWGGSTEFVPVSAKSGEGIDTLLETILLTAEIMELKANPNRRARGLVIEAQLDKGRGPVATVLVQKGTLHVGDFVSAGASHGKVRAMIDDKGRRVKEAGPSTPVEILGLSDVPNAGEVFLAHENDKTAKSYADTFVAQNKEKMLAETKSKMSLDDLFSQIQEGNLKELNLIVKADVQGSVEAVKQSLMKLSNDEVVVKCIHGGVGAINESDVSLASASNAIIIGFNVRPDATAKTTAEKEGVDVRLYKVIYQAIEDIEQAMKGMLDPVYEEKVIGHAEVRQIFKASAVGNIAGSYVLDGRFERGCKIRITREGEQIYEGALASLKRFKDDVKEVKEGFECGLVFEDFDKMQELDIVEAYIMVEVPR